MSVFEGSLDCLAIIGRDNEPVYFKTFGAAARGTSDTPCGDLADPASTAADPGRAVNDGFDEPDPELYLHLLIYSALDLVDSRVGSTVQSQVYLGVLCAIDQRKVYAFVTTTGTKLIIVSTDERNALASRENAMRTFFETLHGIYVDTLCNPFGGIGAGGRESRFVPSARFEAKVLEAVDGVSKAWFGGPAAAAAGMAGAGATGTVTSSAGGYQKPPPPAGPPPPETKAAPKPAFVPPEDL